MVMNVLKHVSVTLYMYRKMVCMYEKFNIHVSTTTGHYPISQTRNSSNLKAET